jgi:hypothetical protein
MLFKSVLAILVTTTAAFSPMQPVMIRPTSVGSMTTTARNIMTEDETSTILQKSEECIASECSLDEVDDLLVTLKETEKELEDRLSKIMNMISHLQHINEKEERKTDEVREFVRDMLRVFSTDKPMVFPTGFSGDIGKGSQTAYDVLPPKKWTNPDKK